MASSPRERFADFVASTGRRITEQMARVVDTALDHSGTFSHDDVLAGLQGKTSRATVYRTLAKLVEAGVLRQVRFNGREVFVIAATDD
jgi:Fur family ferric uptake transcriptional regulator